MADLSITAASVVRGSNASTQQADAGVAITAGQALYISSATGKFALADSNSGTAEAKAATHIALNGAAANQPVLGQKSGDITIGATLTPGATYWLSDTPGGICPDADVGSGENACQIGIAISASVLRVAIQAPGIAR